MPEPVAGALSDDLARVMVDAAVQGIPQRLSPLVRTEEGRRGASRRGLHGPDSPLSASQSEAEAMSRAIRAAFEGTWPER
jgi:hypothetical protein